MASSSSSPTPSNQQNWNWDVFISFRGKDTRRNFLSFLFDALEKKGIKAFKDIKLRKGAEITSSILQTIQESYMSIVIFSKRYVDSPWCLDELVQINECREKSRQNVVPVFYRVDPIDVQELEGYFAKALYKLRKEHSKRKIRRWRHALKKISNDLSGLVSTNYRDEQNLVEEIVADVWEKLKYMPSSSSFVDKLVGIESRVDEVKQLVDLKVNDWRTIGIWGMHGIGKSTLASQLFHLIKNEFDVCYFASNVRKEEGIVLRERIIGELLGDKNLQIGRTDTLSEFIKRMLGRKKVLLVLDDVDSFIQLNLLTADFRLYREGSRVIIASTDRQVVVNVCKEEHVYEVERLSHDNEALPLFCYFAFHQDQPKDGFGELSNEVIWYAQGNPLAIRVLGSNFYGMEKEDWGRELDKLKCIPNMEIQQILKVSYYGLDRDEQSIFLDIACLLRKLEDINKVKRVLEDCGFHAERGIRRLLDKSLLTFKYGAMDMHNLIEQMGKEIVNEESKRPGERSRLWNSKDIFDLFRTNMGTQNIEGISLDLGEIRSECKIELSSTFFMKMPKLRFLHCYGFGSPPKILLPSGIDYLPEQLRYLGWDYFPSNSLSLNFWAYHLVELRLHKSYLQELSGGEEPLNNLKFVNLSFSESLMQISNSFKAPNLEELDLCFCKSLVEIPSSLEYMSKLKILNLGYCANIRECPVLPCNLRELYLYGTLIKQLPSSIGHCSQLVTLNLDECRELENLPDFIGQLGTLSKLKLFGCSKLSCLPESVCKLRYLEEISLICCSKLEELPSNLGDLKSLGKLYARRSGIKTLPSSINQLSQLLELDCRGCQGLTRLPPLTGLTSLQTLDLGECGILEIPESIGSLVSLVYLVLDGNDFESIPASINQVSKLKIFSVSNCKRLRNFPELPCTGSLRVSNCISLEYASCSSLFLEQKAGHVSVDFLGCTNLNKQASLKIMEEVLSTYPNEKGLILRIPGGELPEKIRHRASGSHISFEVEKHHNIRGYLYCVVIDSPDKCWQAPIWCIASFKDTFGKIHRFNIKAKGDWREFNLNSEHVIIWYKPFCCKESFTEASFQFSSKYQFKSSLEDSFEFSDEDSDQETGTNVIQCGIHPVQAKSFADHTQNDNSGALANGNGC